MVSSLVGSFKSNFLFARIGFVLDALVAGGWSAFAKATADKCRASLVHPP